MSTESQPNISQQDAELAINIIAEQIGNIKAAIFTMDEAHTSAQQHKLHFQMFQQVFRMCFCWLILTAAKVEELWRSYGILATPYAKERMRGALKKISARGLTDMRNSAIAHVLDRDTRKPVTPEQIEEMIKTVSKGNLLTFIHWLRHPDDQRQKRSVERCVCFARTSCEHSRMPASQCRSRPIQHPMEMRSSKVEPHSKTAVVASMRTSRAWDGVCPTT
ncbi:MAG TPA: hypothetical protein VFN13_12505 [Rudaea sp.]|nr:hypothetical protein [Rudaea sp.]